MMAIECGRTKVFGAKSKDRAGFNLFTENSMKAVMNLIGIENSDGLLQDKVINACTRCSGYRMRCHSFERYQ